MADEDLSTREFGATFKKFMDTVARQAPEAEPFFRARLREHFGSDPSKLPVVSETTAMTELPNLHLALEAWLAGPGRTHELVGIARAHEYFSANLSQLAAPASGASMSGMVVEGPVQYHNVSLGKDKVLACVQTGLYFVRDGDRRLAVLLNCSRESPWSAGATLEVMGPDREAAAAFLNWIRSERRRRSIYRGRVISLEMDRHGELKVAFHDLPTVSREDIILPLGLLERIERLTVDFSRITDRLKAAGRHLKRGLLLHGPPGTGKTLTAMHLAGRMPDRTVLLMTGAGMGLLEKSCAMARMLQPATVILEDVDLIAEERASGHATCNSILFELLNQMDGLADDADVLFLLTTNRPDILEPALASRPGRIDQAFEIPLPDLDGRRRLLQLYGRGLDMRLKDEPRLLQRTEGVSAAFIRELLRKAAVVAAEKTTGPIVVTDAHVDEAFQELIVQGGELTKSLLGFKPKKA